jgi:hypothetical protein
VQIAQLGVERSVVGPIVSRALLAGVPRCVRVRHLLREQQEQDAEVADGLVRNHDDSAPPEGRNALRWYMIRAPVALNLLGPGAHVQLDALGKA